MPPLHPILLLFFAVSLGAATTVDCRSTKLGEGCSSCAVASNKEKPCFAKDGAEGFCIDTRCGLPACPSDVSFPICTCDVCTRPDQYRFNENCRYYYCYTIEAHARRGYSLCDEENDTMANGRGWCLRPRNHAEWEEQRDRFARADRRCGYKCKWETVEDPIGGGGSPPGGDGGGGDSSTGGGGDSSTGGGGDDDGDDDGDGDGDDDGGNGGSGSPKGGSGGSGSPTGGSGGSGSPTGGSGGSGSPTGGSGGSGSPTGGSGGSSRPSPEGVDGESTSTKSGSDEDDSSNTSAWLIAAGILLGVALCCCLFCFVAKTKKKEAYNEDRDNAVAASLAQSTKYPVSGPTSAGATGSNSAGTRESARTSSRGSSRAKMKKSKLSTKHGRRPNLAPVE